MPSKWKVPDGFVLTWYPPFTFPYAVAEDRTVLVYDDDEPFIDRGRGWEPNVSEAPLSDFDEHPGQYALNIRGEEPGFDPDNPVRADAVQRYGSEVSS